MDTVISVTNRFYFRKYYICQFIQVNHKGLFRRISDSTIIEGIRKQDEKVLAYLYNHYFQTVKNHVIKNSGTDDDVSDVFQDTIIAFYNQISEGNFTLTTDLKGYFFGIARNIWSAQLRHKRRTTELNIDISDEEDADEVYDRALEKIMSRAFRKLKPDCQMILILFSEGISFADIAVKMDLTDEVHARRKKYLCKEALIEMVRKDPEYQEHLRLI